MAHAHENPCLLVLTYPQTSQARSASSKPLPFAIMTSEDTHVRTKQLLEQNAYFGLRQSQVSQSAGTQPAVQMLLHTCVIPDADMHVTPAVAFTRFVLSSPRGPCCAMH